MRSKTLGLLGVVAALVVATSIVSFAPAAFAANNNNQNNNQRAGNNQQTGLVNAGNVQVGANVGVTCSVIASC